MINYDVLISNRVKQKGFTLIELMVVVVIVAILAAIALPTYESYARRATESKVKQEIFKLVEQLERHKSRNFNYKNFVLTVNNLPDTYLLDLKDGTNTSQTLAQGIGQKWVMKVSTTDARLYSFLVTSGGLKCKNMTADNITYNSCGTGVEEW